MNRVILTSAFIVGVLSSQNIQTEWSTDTITVFAGDSVINLSHEMVIENTISDLSGMISEEDFVLNSLTGKLLLNESIRKPFVAIIKFEYVTSHFPSVTEPPIEDLPQLETILESKEIRHSTPVSEPMTEEYPLVTNGSIFRGVTVSPLSGVSMTGGLRLMLQGQVAEDVAVTGSLTDQNSPIQPEGNTQALDEIDEVYLEVKHPSATITAGDIDLSLSGGRFISVERRLEGMTLSAGKGLVKSEITLGSTKGKFAEQEIMGEDQNQGPYRLYSEMGSRNIIVMAGSERIWLNGRKLTRGENFDYTIDYSVGEITFTTKNVIDSNKRIHVEYEYSDLVYPRNIAAATGEFRSDNEKSHFTISWLRENDNSRSDLLFSVGDDEMELMEHSGDEKIRIYSAEEDSSANYRFTTVDSIYEYVPDEEKIDGEIYFDVSFYNIGTEGEYSRQITEDGIIYFEWLPVDDRDSHYDLFVPWRTIQAPETHQVLDFSGRFDLGESTNVSFELSGSQRDQNSLSVIDDNNNFGAAGLIQLNHSGKLASDFGALDITLSHRKRDSRFSPFQRDRQVEFSREWNLALTENVTDENITEMGIQHTLGEFLQTSFDFGSYSDSYQTASRWAGGIIHTSNWVPLFEASATTSIRDVGGSGEVLLIPINPSNVDSSGSGWLRKRLEAKLLPGKFHPLLRLLQEERTADFKFDEKTAAILFEGTKIHGSVGLTERSDFRQVNDADSLGDWEEVSSSQLGELDFSGRWRNGYRIQLSLRQKLKTFSAETDDISYSLAKASFSYRLPRSFITANFDGKLEQSLYEEKIALYDSVGVGLGSYRYDSDYDQYFPDPNGEYILFHIPSGNRTPTSRLISGFRLVFDFRRLNSRLLRNFTLKSFAKSDLNGSDISSGTVFSPQLSDTTIKQSRLNFRNELTYSPRGTRRKIRISTRNRVDMTADNFQGDLHTTENMFSMNAEEPISRKVLFSGEINSHNHQVKSSFESRVRSLNGWILSSGVSWQSSKQMEFGITAEYGKDDGENFYETFSVSSTGIKLHSQLFTKKGGRFEASLDYVNVKSPDELISLLPPEAAGGRQIGSSFLANLTGFLIFGENITANAHLSYILDPLHDGILTITGEIRAAL